MNQLTCKECGKPVLRHGDELIRQCNHTGPIVASLKATAYGESSVSKSGPQSK